MRERRAFYRTLLKELLAATPGSEGLYVPRGEEGMRRMIRHLLAIHPWEAEHSHLAEAIRTFRELEESFDQA